MNYPEEAVKIRRLLRNRSSREYFKEGGWTKNAEEAKDFSDIVEVAQTCAKHDLKDVEVALRYQTCENDVFCTQIR